MSFNAESFLNQTVESANQDSVIPHSEGEFEGQITKLDIKDGTSKESGKVWAQLIVTITCSDPQVAADMGVDDAKITDRMFLDLTDEGGLDFGTNRNVALGKLRTAAGMNEDGVEFSLAQLKGASLGYVVKHRMKENGDPSGFVSTYFNPEEDEE